MQFEVRKVHAICSVSNALFKKGPKFFSHLTTLDVSIHYLEAVYLSARLCYQ